MTKLKSLITKILEEESGDFSFIVEKLREEEEIVPPDALKRRVLAVLRSWKGLKKEKGSPKGPKGRIAKYSLE